MRIIECCFNQPMDMLGKRLAVWLYFEPEDMKHENFEKFLDDQWDEIKAEIVKVKGAGSL